MGFALLYTCVSNYEASNSINFVRSLRTKQRIVKFMCCYEIYCICMLGFSISAVL